MKPKDKTKRNQMKKMKSEIMLGQMICQAQNRAGANQKLLSKIITFWMQIPNDDDIVDEKQMQNLRKHTHHTHNKHTYTHICLQLNQMCTKLMIKNIIEKNMLLSMLFNYK